MRKKLYKKFRKFNKKTVILNKQMTMYQNKNLK